MEDLSSYITEEYHRSEKYLNGLSGSAFQEIRRSAFESFRAMEFPTTRNEEWKHTNIKALLSAGFTQALSTASDEAQLVSDFEPDAADHVLVFVNGRYDRSRSRCHDSNIVVSGLHEAYASHQSVIDQHLSQGLATTINAFVAANTACMNDGAFIMIPEGHRVSGSIVVLSLIDARAANTMIQPRNLMLVAKNAHASVIMRTQTIGTGRSLSNQVSECVVAENAHLDVIMVQDDTERASQVHTLQCQQYRSSVASFVTISLSGEVLRNDLGTRLRESGSEAHMYGLYCIKGSTVVDNHTVMDHMVPHCHSNELYKGVLDGHAQGVFNGKIFVRQDAQKTLAYQSNRNVLLSETATVNTKPQLEIFADDVKCSHGCTVGKMDEEALFYLRARGIGEQNARALLLTAFAEDVTAKIEHEGLQTFVNRRIENTLKSR